MSTPSHPGLGDLQPVPASPCCCRETPQSVYSHGNVTNNHPVGWFFGPVGSSFGAFSVCALHWSRAFSPEFLWPFWAGRMLSGSFQPRCRSQGTGD